MRKLKIFFSDLKASDGSCITMLRLDFKVKKLLVGNFKMKEISRGVKQFQL